MSTVIWVAGKACSSSQDQRRISRPSGATRENDQVASATCGVGPADSTGKSSVVYWPGGTRSARASFGLLPRNPRLTTGRLPSSVTFCPLRQVSVSTTGARVRHPSCGSALDCCEDLPAIAWHPPGHAPPIRSLAGSLAGCGGLLSLLLFRFVARHRSRCGWRRRSRRRESARPVRPADPPWIDWAG